MSVPPVIMLGSAVEPGYTFEAARSSAPYMTDSMDEGGAAGSSTGSGTIATVGSLMTLPISLRKPGTSSSGRARISIVASAVEGITFGAIPAASIVGTTEVRNTE